jgi:hypothetical protein
MRASTYVCFLLTATLIAGAAGVAWGWFGTGGYEAGNSMIGTGFLCALLGAGLTAVVLDLVQRKRRRSQTTDGDGDRPD